MAKFNGFPLDAKSLETHIPQASLTFPSTWLVPTHHNSNYGGTINGQMMSGYEYSNGSNKDLPT